MRFWSAVLSAIEARVSKQNFDIWFRPTAVEEENEAEKKLVVRVPNEYFRYWIRENYASVIDEAIRSIGLGKWTWSLIVAKSGKISNRKISPQATLNLMGPCPQAGQCNLNSKYTFDRFVVGASNQFAHAAALAVAEQPSKAYNPLFLYGGVGLGKTHLMHAIGHYLKIQSPEVRLTYMSSERFMNDLINSIRYDKTIQFREKYRNIDVLLMDDIEFLAGKERTQEEFFHTFNELYDNQKQIVISSDCAPRQIPTLEERLHSRFEWGLIADIQLPDLETKVAILKKKAELEAVNLPDEVVFFIAQHIRSNIRELEGSLIRLVAFSSLTGEKITLGLAEKVLKNIADQNARITTAKDVQRVVANHFSLSPTDLRTKSNSRRIAEPRQIAMFLTRKLTKESLPQIGKAFGGKHHTTVLHSVKKIERLSKEDTRMKLLLERLKELIR